jgi:RNA polymerase sigma factor (sigma-70 family)
LVKRAQQGDRQACEDLFTRCDGNVRRWARAEVGEDRADDLRQEVLMRAHRKLKSLDVPEAFLGWLRVMTRRLAYNLLKRERPERRWWTSAANDRSLDIFELIPGRESDPALEYLEEADRQACLEIIWQVVARMEPRQRLLAELYYREGRSIAQIAHRLGTRRKPLPEGTVKTHLNRLRKTIRKEVLGLGALVELPHAPMLA